MEVESAQMRGAAFEVSAGSLQGFASRAAAQSPPTSRTAVSHTSGRAMGAALRMEAVQQEWKHREGAGDGLWRDVVTKGLSRHVIVTRQLPCQRLPSALGSPVVPRRNTNPRASAYLSKLRRDSVGADFQSVHKLTNYVCAAPPESCLSVFRNTYK